MRRERYKKWRFLVVAIALGSAVLMIACSQGPISYQEAKELEAQIEAIRSRLGTVESQLAALKPAEDSSEKDVSSIREELKDMRGMLAEIKEAIAPPEIEQSAPRQSGQPGRQPGQPGQPLSPAR